MVPTPKTIKNTGFILISFAILLVIAAMPLCFDGVVQGDDYAFHLSRVENIAQGLKQGDFPVKIHSEFLNGFGYGAGLFYPNFFLFIPALLMVLGVSFEISYKIFFVLLFLSLLCSSYFSAKQIFKKQSTAFFVTVLYFSSQSVFSNTFNRIAIGEALGTIFIPVVIAALYNLVYDDFSKPRLLIIGFLGMVLSHTITLFLSVIIATVFLACNFEKLFLNSEKPKNYGKKLIGKVVFCALIVLSLSIAYWLPMLEQFATSKFQVSDPWTYIGENAAPIYKLFFLRRPGVGIMLLVLALVFAFLPATKGSLWRRFIVGGLVIALITTNLIPWKWFDHTIFNSIQFPWRLIPYSGAFLSFGVAGCITETNLNRFSRNFALAITIGATVLTTIMSVAAVGKITHLSTDIVKSDWAIGFGEWLPEKTDVDRLDYQGFVKTENGERLELSKKIGTSLSFEVHETKSEFYDTPLLYYKGYSAFAVSEQGEKIPLTVVSGENNVVRVVGKDISGKVSVYYKGTNLQTVGYAINLTSLLLTLIFFIYKALKGKSLSKRKMQI